MKMLARFLLPLYLLLASITGSWAADRYWVCGGSSTNWNATGNTNWAATSGGAGNQSVPGSGDNVFFDTNSNCGNSVLSANITINNFDFTGYTGTFTHNAVFLAVAGNGVNAKLSSGMTYSPANSQSAVIRFTGTSGTNTFDSAGKALAAFDQNGVGGRTNLASDLAVTSGSFPILNLTNGHFDANDFAVNTGFFNSTNSNVRTLSMGNADWTLSGSGTIWNTGTITNLTFNKEGADIIIPGITGDFTQFTAGALTYNDLIVSTAGRTTLWNLQLNSASTWNAWTLNSAMNITLSANVTVTNGFTWTGDATHTNTLRSTAMSTARTLTTSGTISGDYVSLQNITCSGGTFSFTNSFDAMGNTDCNISPPSGGGGGSSFGTMSGG